MSCEKTDISFAFWMQENLSFLFCPFLRAAFRPAGGLFPWGRPTGRTAGARKHLSRRFRRPHPRQHPAGMCVGGPSDLKIYTIFQRPRLRSGPFFRLLRGFFTKVCPQELFWGPDFCGTCSIASKILGKFFYDPPKIDHFPTICTFHKGTFAFWCAILSYGAPEKSGAGKRKN